MVPIEARAVAEILLSHLRGQVSISFIASLQQAEAGPGLLSHLFTSNLVVPTQHLRVLCTHPSVVLGTAKKLGRSSVKMAKKGGVLVLN